MEAVILGRTVRQTSVPESVREGMGWVQMRLEGPERLCKGSELYPKTWSCVFGVCHGKLAACSGRMVWAAAR